jgi:hypothetical protein
VEGAGGCFLWSPENLLKKNLTYTSNYHQKHIENGIFVENL